jgi:hypothetical protein
LSDDEDDEVGSVAGAADGADADEASVASNKPASSFFASVMLIQSRRRRLVAASRYTAPKHSATNGNKCSQNTPAERRKVIRLGALEQPLVGDRAQSLRRRRA